MNQNNISSETFKGYWERSKYLSFLEVVFPEMLPYFSENKLDFKGCLQRILKPISDQNLFSWNQS